MIFASHPKFHKEIDEFLKKHHQDDGWLFKLQNLLTSHFETKKTHLGNNVLSSLKEYKDYCLWKIDMVVGGVTKGQRPRVCLAKKEEEIIFLCFGTHTNNYITKDLIILGIKRLKEFIGE